MSNEYFYRQVELVRTLDYGGYLYTTITRIPKDLAVIGRFVELKDKDNDNILNTWQVVSVDTKDIFLK